MHVSRKLQSGTIANALLIFLLVFGMLVVSAGTSIFQIRLSNHEEGTEGARALAEATAQVMIARLIKDQGLDSNTRLDGGNFEMRLTLPETYPGGEGLLTLNSSRATALDIPLSYNNLTNGNAVTGRNGLAVAAETANLVAVGRYRNQECKIEVVLNIPKFPYVVSSTVPLEGENMTVFGVSDPSALVSGFNVPDDKRETGHIATNAPGTGSLTLKGTSNIKGDAQSRGTVVKTDPTVVVSGEIRNQAALAPVPDVDLTTFDPDNRPGATVTDLGSSIMGGTPISGFNKSDTQLDVNGNLNLNGGVVFVDGPVRITGGISGNGALIATGSVEITGGGGASFTGANGAAILAGGDLTLSGAGPSAKQDFRGLVYTTGNLSTNNVNIAGSVAINNTSGTGQPATVKDTNMVESQQLATVSIPVTVTVAPPGGLDPGPATYHANLGGTGNYGFPGDASHYMTANMNGVNPDYNNPPPGYVITQRPTDDPSKPYYQIAMPTTRPADVISMGSIRVNEYVNGQFEKIGEDWDSRAEAEAALQAVNDAWGSNIDIQRFLDDSEAYHWNTGMPGFVAQFNANAAALANAPQVAPGTPGAVTIPSFVKIDFSQFYNVSDRIRIFSWREI